MEVINFDEEDKLLFSIDDLSLKAKAIKNSILPRLVLLTNQLISEIIQIYKVDFYTDNTITKSPNFRPGKRVQEIRTNYEWATVGITGVMQANKWSAIIKSPFKQSEIVPFTLDFWLDECGIKVTLDISFLKNQTKDTIDLFFNFIKDNVDIVQSLLFKANCIPVTNYENDIKFIETFADYLNLSRNKGWIDLSFESQTIKYPIEYDELLGLIDSAVTLFPIYNSYIELSKHNPTRLKEDVILLNQWMTSNVQFEENLQETKSKTSIDLQEKALLLADEKIKVIPSMRWQVFQRDNWKCVSCGRNADDGIILHVDHIIPRSKGGKDEIDNYQTLCSICNIGKSNKDQTDLRKKENLLDAKPN